MRKLASLLIALAFIAVSFYGCDRQLDPMGPESANTAIESYSTARPMEYQTFILEQPQELDMVTVEGVNNEGTVVGWAFLEEDVVPLLWERGSAEMLPVHVPWANSHAFDINNRGDIVGWQDALGGVLWRHEEPLDMGVGAYPYPAFEVWARAISEDSKVVGEIYRDEEPWVVGFFWDNEEWIELPVLEGWSECLPNGVNESGQIVGTCSPSSRAVMWYDGQVSPLDVPGTYSAAAGINGAGQVVGGSSDGPFMWDHGEVMLLPTLGGLSSAMDINNQGQIAGVSRTPEGESHAVVWQDGEMIDLGTGFARAINDRGWVLGWTYLPNGARENVLWKPRVSG